MTEEKTYNPWILIIHLSFWVMLTVLISFIFNGFVEDIGILIWSVSINLIGFILLVYVNLYLLLPRFFDKELYREYALWLLVLLIVSAVIRFYIGWGLMSWMDSELLKIFDPKFFGSMIVNGAFLLFVSIPLRMVGTWIKRKELEQEIKTQQLEAELRFLKAQVNPHFLFNALNNIYSLSFTGSDKAPEMILKLSDMMSYMLYDCKSEQVLLSAELAYLRNYIELQQLKKDGELNIEFKLMGDPGGLLITPMLFIPFFENSFKHGNLEDLEHGWMKGHLKIEKEGLKFHMSNSYCPGKKESEKGGVGLENIRERLALLFPEKHELDIQQNENIYRVDLSIKI
ncbi:MAG: sensor histidine kinase [Bacteroidia bacterium]|nr:sensor histidine kinase [Bacteroidia bacterium]